MTDPDRIEVELMKACADSHGKDHRFVSIIVICTSVYIIYDPAECVSLAYGAWGCSVGA